MATKTTPPVKRFLTAIESGNTKLVERLIAQGVNVNGELWHESPFSCAIRSNHTHIIALLIRHGLDPRRGDDAPFAIAAYYKQKATLKLLATTVFAPDRWRGKTRAEIEKEADLIYQNIDNNLGMHFPDPMDEQLILARIELFDAAMTCWEHVRPDPRKINISNIPAKGTPV